MTVGFNMHVSKPADTVELLTMAMCLTKGKAAKSQDEAAPQ